MSMRELKLSSCQGAARSTQNSRPSSDKMDDVILIWMVLEWGTYCVMPEKASSLVIQYGIEHKDSS